MKPIGWAPPFLSGKLEIVTSMTGNMWLAFLFACRHSVAVCNTSMM
jgi:hypothetical protein